ncbi:MAG: tetratricopeptide repeat protein [Acidobacteriota bacterium]|nr:tetratricopeptide repeat protein [Acidobacteriota bacterium]
MANFGGSISQLRTGTDTLKDTTINAPDFEFRGKAREDDFMSQLDKMTQAMRRKQEEQSVEFKLSAFDAGTGLAEEGVVSAQGVLDRLLSQAKQLVADERYEEALQPLSEILEANPTHHEARYLFAYCKAQLKEFASALSSLRPLRRARLDHTLAVRVASLKSEIRREMLPRVVLENYLLLRLGQYQAAIERLQDVAELDPEQGMYHYMLAGSLTQAGLHRRAIAAADHGLSECDGEQREMLLALRGSIERGYVAEMMRPARERFKKGQYGKARAVLNRIEPAYRQAPLYVTFATLLARLDGGFFGFLRRGRDAGDINPEGSPADIENFYFFLVEEELDSAKGFIAGEEYEEAESALRLAIGYTRDFPFAHYLYAGCVYTRTVRQITSGDPPVLEEAIADIERARASARLGAADPEISDASALLSVIEQTHKQLTEIRQEQAAREKEIKAVNGVIREFQEIMQMAEGGVGSQAQYREVEARMKGLKKKLPEVKKQARGKEAKKVLGQLAEAVERNLKQLSEVGAQLKEGEAVRGCYERFARKMESLKATGIHSHTELSETRSYFRQLKSDAERVRGGLRQQEAKDSIDRLIAAVGQVLGQLER